MKKLVIAGVGALLTCTAGAESLEGVNEIICAPAEIRLCLEGDECYRVTPSDLDIPDFVIIDTKAKTISTTKGSGLNRSTEFSVVSRKDGLLYLQGIEDGRAFSFVIHEATGKLTGSVARDGFSVSVFGACASTDI